MNNNYVNLKINIPLFVDTKTTVNKMFNLGTDHGSINILQRVNPELIQWFNDKGFIPWACDYFTREPHNMSPIHIDGEAGDKAKLNWVFCDNDNSKMQWFEPIDPTNFIKGLRGSQYNVYTEDNVKLIESATIAGTPTLIKYGIPHRIVNGDSKRVCVCLYLKDALTNDYPTWNRCVDVFREYIT